MNVDEIISITREYVDEPAADAADFDDSITLLPFINLEHRHLQSVIRQRFEDWLGREFVFATQNNVFRYFLPMDSVEVRRIELIEGSAISGTPPNLIVDELNAHIIDVAPIEMNSQQEAAIYFRKTSRNVSVGGYFLYADEIRFAPATEIGNGNYCRIFYTPTGIDLHRALAQAGGASTITLGVNGAAQTTGTVRVIDNYYQWARIEIMSGTGAGQTRRIAQYDGATKLATVDIPWVVIPDGSSIYSIVSPIIDDYHELLALGAAMRSKGIKVEDDDSSIGQAYSAIMTDMKLALERRVLQAPRRTYKQQW